MGRYRPKPDPPPITLGEVRAQGIDLWFSCALCTHTETVLLGSLGKFSDEKTLGELAHRARCDRCKHRGSATVYPETRRWVAYLRRTGQKHRLPYWACFVPEEGDRR